MGTAVVITTGETALVAALAVIVAALLAAWIAAKAASRDLVVKRQLEATDSFLNLVEALDNRAERESGLGKQIAAGWLIAQFGKTNQFLKRAAEETLDLYEKEYRDSQQELADAIRSAHEWMSSN